MVMPSILVFINRSLLKEHQVVSPERLGFNKLTAVCTHSYCYQVSSISYHGLSSYSGVITVTMCLFTERRLMRQSLYVTDNLKYKKKFIRVSVTITT